MQPSSDCIGSAFNSKGVMQCPNCREIEPGEWRFSERRVMPTPERLREVLQEIGGAAQMEVPEYQFCPTHGWGWSVHTTNFSQVDEIDEPVIIVDYFDNLIERAQHNGHHWQPISGASSTADANPAPDMNAAPEPGILQVNHDGSLNAEAHRRASHRAGSLVLESSTLNRTGVHRRSDGIENFATPRDSLGHNDRANMGSSLQLSHVAGTSNSSLSASGLDFVPRQALRAPRRWRLRTTHLVALPVQGTHSTFEIGQTSGSAGRDQDHNVTSGSNDRGIGMESMSRVDASASEGDGTRPGEETPTTEGPGVDPDRESSS